MSGRAPAYRGPVLHFDALRLAALLERGRILKAPATENEELVPVLAPAHVHPAPAPCCCSKLAAHSEPALRTGLVVPALAPCSKLMYLGSYS